MYELDPRLQAKLDRRDRKQQRGNQRAANRQHHAEFCESGGKVFKVVRLPLTSEALENLARKSHSGPMSPSREIVHLSNMRNKGNQKMENINAAAPASIQPTIAAVPNQPPAPATAVVNLNTASQDELCELPGIGPDVAKRIISERSEKHPYVDTLDLCDACEGFGIGKADKLRPLVTF